MPPRPPSSRRASLRDLRDGLLFLAPFLAVYLLYVAWPVVQSVYMSLFDWDLLGFTREFIGLGNYERMLGGEGLVWSADHVLGVRLVLLVAGAVAAALLARAGARTWAIVVAVVTVAGWALLGVHPGEGGRWNDPLFWRSLEQTVLFTLASTPLIVGLGLLFALLLNGRGRSLGFYRALLFLPYVLPVSAVTLIWSLMLNPRRGLIAGLLEPFGIDPPAWLASPDLAMPAIIATTVWWTIGFTLVLFLAGLQDIDPSLYEAASLDGASAGQKFRAITLPGLRNVSVLVIVTQLVAAFQIFGQVYIMTRGGPANSTRVLIQHIYEAGFRDFELGYAAAVSLLLFTIMAGVSAVQFRVLGRSS